MTTEGARIGFDFSASEPTPRNRAPTLEKPQFPADFGFVFSIPPAPRPGGFDFSRQPAGAATRRRRELQFSAEFGFVSSNAVVLDLAPPLSPCAAAAPLHPGPRGTAVFRQDWVCSFARPQPGQA